MTPDEFRAHRRRKRASAIIPTAWRSLLGGYRPVVPDWGHRLDGKHTQRQCNQDRDARCVLEHHAELAREEAMRGLDHIARMRGIQFGPFDGGGAGGSADQACDAQGKGAGGREAA